VRAGQKPPRSRGRLAAFLLATWAAALAHPAPVSGGEALEYEVKAVYLYKFGNFIEWPASAFASPASAVNLCIAGTDPFGTRLDAAAAGQHIGARSIVVRRLQGVSRDANCQILFVGGSDSRGVARILDAVRGAGVLTVTDASSAGETPSIIRFVVQDDRVRFVIDRGAASLNGIIVSSKLQSLALPGDGGNR
jgi:hypothetical protein